MADEENLVGLLRSMRRSDPNLAVDRAREAIEIRPDDPEVRDAASSIFFDNLYESFRLPRDEEHLTDRMALLRTMTSWTPLGPYSTSNASVHCVLSVANAFNAAKRSEDARATLDLLRVNDITDKRNRKFPSLRSRWYVIRTKSLEDLRRWSELEACCVEAISNSTIGRTSREKVAMRLERARRELSRE